MRAHHMAMFEKGLSIREIDMGIYIYVLKKHFLSTFYLEYLERRLKANRKASWRQNFVPNKYTINHFPCFILQSVLLFLSLALEPQPFQSCSAYQFVYLSLL